VPILGGYIVRISFISLAILMLLLFYDTTSNFAAEDVQKPTKTLYQAVFDGDIEQTKLNISQGADINEKTRDGQTLLHVALSYGHTSVAKLLIDEGVDINATDKSGKTPLHLAAFKGNTEAIEFLIAKEGLNVDAKDSQNRTPLHFAAEYGHKDIVEKLIAKGADINAQTNRQQNALSLARKKGHKEIEDLLLKHGAKEPVLSNREDALYDSDGRPNLYADLAPRERITDQEQPVTRAITQINVKADPNEIKERIGKFEGLKDEINKLEKTSKEEEKAWLQRRFDNRTGLVKDVQNQFEAELTFIRKLAVEEEAQKTTEAIDKLLTTRKQRFKKVRQSLREEKREERQADMQGGRGSRYTSRGSRRAETQDSRSRTTLYRRSGAEEPSSGRYSSRTSRGGPNGEDEPEEEIDTQTKNEIRDWLQTTPENKLRLAESVHKQLTTELTSIKNIAIEEKAEKTAAAIDGLLLSRQQRFTRTVQIMEEENRKAALEQNEDEASPDRSSDRTSRRSTRGRYGNDEGYRSGSRDRRRR
jgi:ankyrin repeat protein